MTNAIPHGAPADAQPAEEPPDIRAAAMRRRAARWLWCIGVIQIPVCLRLLVNGIPELLSVWTGNTAGGTRDGATEPVWSDTTLAAAMQVFAGLWILLPAAAFIILAFGVRRGHRRASTGGFIGLYAQLALAGYCLLWGLYDAFEQRSPVHMTGVVLVCGTIAAVLMGAVRAVRMADRATAAQQAIATDPWR